MSAFTETNVPEGNPGTSARAAIEYAKAYDNMHTAFNEHISEKAGADGVDPHGIKAYIDTIEAKAKDIADSAKSKANIVENILAGKRATGMSPALYLVSLLGGNTDIIATVKALLDRIAALETELNTLSLLQFDNVPVGAGIRWYKETLPADGTYVWANGQTLYGVNQNFPDLARVWELGSSDNVVVPKEDHTIFKVRKATVQVKPIEHAYIAPAEGTASNDILEAIAELRTAVAALQQGA